MNIILWIIFGALAGWIASLVTGTNAEYGLVKNILIGVGGALLGGFIARLFGLGNVSGFDAVSLLIAVFGAVLIIMLIRVGRSNK